jgi:hypothetical protein
VDPVAAGGGSICVLRGLSFLGAWWDSERREFRTGDSSNTLGLRIVCTSLSLQASSAVFRRREATGNLASRSKLGKNSAPLNERAAALWVLGQRGVLRIGKYSEAIRSADTLPAGEINVLEVDLSSNKQISNDDLKKLRALKALERLGLDGTNITDAGLIHLLTLEHLKNIAICGTAITDAGIATLQKLPKLEYLWVRGTQLTDAAVDRMARFPSLRSIDLRGVKTVTPDELPRRLQALKLEGLLASGMTDAGIFRLSGLPDLKNLGICDSTCSDAGLASLVRFDELIELSLENDKHIMDAGLLHLLKLPKLKVLILRGTNLTDGAIRKFQAAKPNCRILH